jgi:hypothetical protein
MAFPRPVPTLLFLGVFGFGGFAILIFGILIFGNFCALAGLGAFGFLGFLFGFTNVLEVRVTYPSTDLLVSVRICLPSAFLVKVIRLPVPPLVDVDVVFHHLSWWYM